MHHKRSLLFWGELPPNIYHGISLSNKRILSILSKKFYIYKVKDNAGFGSKISKSCSFITSLFKIIYFSFNKPNIYYSNLPMSTFGLYKTLITIKVVKLVSPKTKIVTHLHRGDFLEFINIKTQKKLIKKSLDIINTIIVLSDKSAFELIKSGLIEPMKITVIPNSIDVLTSPSNINVNRSITQNESYLYCLCNYIPTKRIHCLVDIINKSIFTNTKFNGDKTNIEYMNSLINKDIHSFCYFGGVIDGKEKERKLNTATALVLPSLNEGMPLVILESLAQGTPVICFNIGFISDYLGADYPGLVNDLTDDAMQKKIKWLQSLSSNEYQKLRTLSFNLFWGKYSHENIKNKILHEFEAITLLK
ncbi:glycosyltransferase family 4 protein [Pseudocolwellia agarivorans]|uniref:glycosyltransferase family 4 protein n=1 Tax=Pseudocolwellia agarivorans TaxID=1911682 RepID=UPI003F880B62